MEHTTTHVWSNATYIVNACNQKRSDLDLLARGWLPLHPHCRDQELLPRDQLMDTSAPKQQIYTWTPKLDIYIYGH